MQVATSVRNEIRDALNQGKMVTVHEKPLDYHGWQGSGYIILDPDTAAGAYKISGGANGGYLDEYASNIGSTVTWGLLISGLLMILGAATGAVFILPLSLILSLIAVFHMIMTMMVTDLYLLEKGCPNGYRGLAAALNGLLFPLRWLPKHAAGTLISAIMGFLVPRTVKAPAGACSI